MPVRQVQDGGVPTDRGFTARDVRMPFLFSEPRISTSHDTRFHTKDQHE